jgi:hypothetical protein
MKNCEVCGRKDKNVYLSKKANLSLCPKHLYQYKKNGKFLDTNPRTVNDLNEIVVHEDYAEITLYDSRQNETARALIDKDDVEKVKDLKWRLFDGYVVSSSITGHTTYLHRYITDYDDDLFVDHKDIDKLNNKKSNLRPCTQSENNMNTKKRSSNKSGYKGVVQDKKTGRYKAYIGINKRTRALGTFDTAEEAHLAYTEKAKEVYGEFANTDNNTNGGMLI